MNHTPRPRQWLTSTQREARHRAQVVAANLGQSVRVGRLRLGVTQAQLAARVGVHQAWISRIELGHGRRVPLELWIALGVALERPIAISLSRPLGEPREPADAGHLAMQERLLELARATGRHATFELPTRPRDSRHSIDVCVRDVRHRTLIVQEAWNTFADLGAAIRTSNRKAVEAVDLAASVDDGPPYRVALVWVVRPTAANRRTIVRYPGIFRSAFPGSSRRWLAALTNGTPPPDQPGLVWLDPAAGQVTEWRQPARLGSS